MKRFITLLIATALFSCTGNDHQTETETGTVPGNGIAAPAQVPASLISEFPHDPTAFTEGLFIYNGKLYEGTGEYKESRIQISDIKTGKIEKQYPITDSTIFGEGINILNNQLFQLTYKNHRVFVYDLNDLSKPIKTFPWLSECWGITNNGTELIISDGSAEGKLYFVNPDDFRIKRILQVTDNMGAVDSINELEFINGYIYANVWGNSYLIKIDPSNGHVLTRYETANSLSSFYSGYQIRELDNVLNGIAYDSVSKKIYITGKRWPKLFEVQLN